MNETGERPWPYDGSEGRARLTGSAPVRSEPMSETDDRCPDCGRAECTGEDCYWPDDAGITRPKNKGETS